MVENSVGTVDTITVDFDLAVFSIDTVKRAAYRMTGNASFDIDIVGNRAVCVARFSKSVSPEVASKFAEGLRLEVLDQDLRASIAAETAPVRNAVLALAFSRSGLQSID
jgi:His-Xaa-Ser system protein HxsD